MTYFTDAALTKIGIFDVISEQLVISDPCYNKDIGYKCSLIVPAENGKWEAFIKRVDEGSWGYRVAALVVYLEGSNYFGLPFKRADSGGSVDSGQLGVFCSSIYPEGRPTGEYGDLKTFYGRACALTANENPDKNENFFDVGILDGRGINSSSGFGDGDYPVEVAYNEAGKAVGVRVEFIEEDDQEGYDDICEMCHYASCECDDVCMECGVCIDDCECDEEDED